MRMLKSEGSLDKISEIDGADPLCANCDGEGWVSYVIRFPLFLQVVRLMKGLICDGVPKAKQICKKALCL